MLPIIPFLLALLGTLFMTGVIWFMQLLEYPFFALVGPAEFPAFHAFHNRGLPVLVFLPTLVTLASVCVLVWIRPAGIPTWPIITMIGLLLVTILSTVTWQAPLHRRLDRDGLSLDTVQALTRANWVRTVAWTANTILILYMVAAAVKAA